jgi:hypothetical protein
VLRGVRIIRICRSKEEKEAGNKKPLREGNRMMNSHVEKALFSISLNGRKYIRTFLFARSFDTNTIVYSPH